MTRVTFGMFRKGAREPATTLAAVAGEFTPRTPLPTATAALTRHHRDGPAAARAYMERSYHQSAYWGQRGTPQAGWAEALVACYATYVSLTEQDRRPAFAAGLNRDLVLTPDELAVHIDVLLLDPDGYVPRIVLWDANQLTRPLAVLYAAPAWRVMEQELGAGRTARVEVWSLRKPTQIAITPAEASAAMPEVARIIHRLVS
jgi:hypothetical protein